MEDKKRMNPGKRLIEQRKMMFNGPKIKAALDHITKQWLLMIELATELGINLDVDGEVKAPDENQKKAWNSLNKRVISRELTGGDLNITTAYIPRKYAWEVLEITKAVEDAYARIYKRRYATAKRDREFAKIKQSLAKKTTIKKTRKTLIDNAVKSMESYK